MNRSVAGAMGLAVALGGGAVAASDYRNGQSRPWLLRAGAGIIVRRDTSPAQFWAWTVVNWVLIGVISFGGIAAMLLPGAP